MYNLFNTFTAYRKVIYLRPCVRKSGLFFHEANWRHTHLMQIFCLYVVRHPLASLIKFTLIRYQLNNYTKLSMYGSTINHTFKQKVCIQN